MVSSFNAFITYASEFRSTKLRNYFELLEVIYGGDLEEVFGVSSCTHIRFRHLEFPSEKHLHSINGTLSNLI